MSEREKPISQSEAWQIKAELDSLLPTLEEEKRLEEREEEALLLGIEWAIRFRSRMAQLRRETGIAPSFEESLDNPEEQCVWLLTMGEWIFPEENRADYARRKADRCATHLVLGMRRAGEEVSVELTQELLKEWSGRFGALTTEVNPKTINAALKRRLFYYRRHIDLGLLTDRQHIAEHRQEYEIHLGLHRALNRLTDDGTFPDNDYYPPPLPF